MAVSRLIALSKTLDTTPFNWLQGRTFSEAFVICIGAGPWKFNRRKTIQEKALNKLNKRDLSRLRNVNWYPLEWQNKFVNNVRRSLTTSMEEFCCKLMCPKCVNPNEARQYLFNAAGCPKGSKVLSLFCRDALRIPAFPIDRHVKRYLIKHKLPTNENSMIKLCMDANLDPCHIAVGFVRAASDMDNPNWSVYS